MHVAEASKSKHWDLWGALRGAGVPIISTWPDWQPNQDGSEPDADSWRAHSEACINDAASGDVLLLYAKDDERQFGALLEAGAALGAGKQVYIVSPHPWPFLRNHPRCRSFDTLESAVVAIMAMADGKRLRRAA